MYFHGIMTICMRKNKYDLLKDDSGNWVTDSQALEHMVIDIYKICFKMMEVIFPFLFRMLSLALIMMF